MKSRISKEFVQKPAEFFKNSSTNFLENERNFTVIERGCVSKNVESVKGKEEIVKEVAKEVTNGAVKKEAECFKNSSKSFLENERYHYESKNIDENRQKSSTISQSQERYVFSAGSLKRYVTTCYFQPKQIPVSYSETMILNIGSSKKKFFESIYYKNTLLPHKWSESMHTTIKKGENEPLLVSEITIPIEKSPFHYISLEPQQMIAQEIAQEITVV